MDSSYRGKCVNHNKYGDGIIDGDYRLGPNDRRIRVLYNTGYIANYIFPGDFLNGKVATEDEEILHELSAFNRISDVSSPTIVVGKSRIVRHDIIDEIYSKPQSIPDSIHNGILSLFGVWNLSELPRNEFAKVKDTCKAMFRQIGITDYSATANEYALSYLSLNMYKCWHPLHDLLEADNLPKTLTILELGAGPGTSTFGIIEFYRYIAEENPDEQFCLYFDMIEIEESFGNVFSRLFDTYKATLPSNLFAKYRYSCGDAFEYVKTKQFEYNIIIESNMLNANEKIEEWDLALFSEHLKRKITVKGAIVFIEPDKAALLEAFQTICNMLDSGTCSQLGPVHSQVVNISQDSLVAELRDAGIYSDYQKDEHHFCYAVFQRNY